VFNRIADSNARMLLALTVVILAFGPICGRADDSVSMRVNYSDLDTSTAEGAHLLYSRIEAAAKAICARPMSDTDPIMRDPGPCVRDAVGRAVHGSKNQNVALVYIQRNGVELARRYGISEDMRVAKR
jgi:UrcA family protein